MIGQDYETFGDVIVTPSSREGLRSGKKTRSEAESILLLHRRTTPMSTRRSETAKRRKRKRRSGISSGFGETENTSSGSPGRKNAKVKKTAENGTEREVEVSLFSKTDGPVVGDGGVSSSDLPGEPCEISRVGVRPTEAEESVGR